jgi:hypothetical protein
MLHRGKPACARIVFAALALFAAACAGRLSLLPTDMQKDLPHELPTELKDKFEVRDAEGPAPEPSPSPSPQPVVAQVHGKRKKKKSLEPKPAPSSAPAPAFVYPSRRPPVDPIWPGERETYDITYIGISAGEFVTEVLPFKSVAGRKVYHLRGSAVSSKVFSLFYRLNDSVESFWDFEGLFSHRFHLLLDETKQARDALELNDSEKSQTYYWNRWKHRDRDFVETKQFGEMPPFGQDSISALYYLRTIPLKDGDVITFPVVSEAKHWEAVITVVRRERMDSPLGRGTTCVVLKLDTRFQGVLQKRGDSFLWLTDDDRRFPIRLEAKVRIGTVVAELKKIEPGTAPAVVQSSK